MLLLMFTTRDVHFFLLPTFVFNVAIQVLAALRELLRADRHAIHVLQRVCSKNKVLHLVLVPPAATTELPSGSCSCRYCLTHCQPASTSLGRSPAGAPPRAWSPESFSR